MATDVTSTVVLAIKAALAPIHAQWAAIEQRCKTLETQMGDVGRFRERLAILEARPPVPGPPGKDGVNGKDGASLRYRQSWKSGARYEPGDVVTHDGSAWHCNEATTSAIPGDGSVVWTLMVKHGRDLKKEQP